MLARFSQMAGETSFADILRDGQLRFDGNFGGMCEPNSSGGPAQYGEEAKEPPSTVGDRTDRCGWLDTDEDYFAQPGALYRLIRSEEQARTHDNFARHLGAAPDFTQQRYLGQLDKVDARLGTGVRSNLKKLEMKARLEIETILKEQHTHAAGGEITA